MKIHSCAALLAGSILMVGSAMAADLPMPMPVKAAPVVVVPVFTWTGLYVGGNLGYAWADADYSYAGGSTLGYSSGSQSLSPDGILGGGQIGYNYQFDNKWVIGAEADFQWSDISASLGDRQFAYDTTQNPPVAVAGLEYGIRSKVEWFGTLRARLGYGWDRALIYATGGAAYGSVNTEATLGAAVYGYGLGTRPGTSDTQWGWTVGGGLEYALTDNWIIRAEYLYVDLGSQTVYSYNENGLAAGVDLDTHFSVARAGVNYKF